MDRADFHTRLVGWLKILLPLSALAILSTLFLVSRTINPDAALPYAEVDVEARVREPRMTAPEYAGTTTDGGAITLTADEARPEAAGDASARTVLATLATPDGGMARLTAATARLDHAAGLIALDGGVVTTTGSGYRIDSDAMQIRMDRSGLDSRGAVRAEGPPGQITAGSMSLQRDATRPEGYLLVFKTDVKLIYQPAN